MRVLVFIADLLCDRIKAARPILSFEWARGPKLTCFVRSHESRRVAVRVRDYDIAVDIPPARRRRCYIPGSLQPKIKIC